MTFLLSLLPLFLPFVNLPFPSASRILIFCVPVCLSRCGSVDYGVGL